MGSPMLQHRRAVDAPPWRELALALSISLAAALVSAILDLHEVLYVLSRRFERLQLDELPIALFVFAASVLLLYARRYRQARAELQARRAAETALARALAQNRELARQHLFAEEAERKHLARELHDELGQYLNAIKLDAVRLAGSTDAEARAGAARIVSCADHVHAATTGMIRRLRPVGLDELGLAAALEHCVEEWRRRLPDAQLTLTIDGDTGALGETLDLAVYRLVQEGLTNASRHSRASRIDVLVRRDVPAAGDAGALCVRISDDGVGLRDGAGEGFGLTGMRERVSLLGGELVFHSAPDEGVVLEARLPVQVRP